MRGVQGQWDIFAKDEYLSVRERKKVNCWVRRQGVWSKMGSRHRANRRFRPVAVNTVGMGIGRGAPGGAEFCDARPGLAPGEGRGCRHSPLWSHSSPSLCTACARAEHTCPLLLPHHSTCLCPLSARSASPSSVECFLYGPFPGRLRTSCPVSLEYRPRTSL